LTRTFSVPALHPLDQFRAFLSLREKGMSEEEIAAVFFVSVLVVKQRLKLASVSPKPLDVYAEDDMTLDQLMAFTVNPDHERHRSHRRVQPERNRRRPDAKRLWPILSVRKISSLRQSIRESRLNRKRSKRQSRRPAAAGGPSSFRGPTMSSQASDLARRLAEQAELVCRHYLSNGRRVDRHRQVSRARLNAGNGATSAF